MSPAIKLDLPFEDDRPGSSHASRNTRTVNPISTAEIIFDNTFVSAALRRRRRESSRSRSVRTRFKNTRRIAPRTAFRRVEILFFTRQTTIAQSRFKHNVNYRLSQTVLFFEISFYLYNIVLLRLAAISLRVVAVFYFACF